MTTVLSSHLTHRRFSWTAWKDARAVRGTQTQYDESDGVYLIWFYDGPEVNLCAIYTGTVPAGVSQQDNDADKADFEANVQPTANLRISDPKAADGKPFVLPNIFPSEVLLNFTGASDKISAPTARFGGALFALEKVGVGTATFNVDVLDGVFLAGGHIDWSGGSWGSSISMKLTAAASTTKAPAVANQGNCNKVQVAQGAYIIVPAAGDGVYDLDTVIPIPAYDDETNAQTGYWNYSEPWVGKGTVSPTGTNTAKYNLFDFPITLAYFTKLHLFLDSGQRDMVAPAIKPKWILPEWQMQVTIDNVDANKTLRAGWDLLVARRKST